ILDDEIESTQQDGRDVSALLELREHKVEAINAVQLAVDGIQMQLDAKNTAIIDMRAAVSKEANFTPELLEELNQFIEEEDWSDSNQFDDKMLYVAGIEEFERRKFPPVTLNLDIVNFLESVTEQRNWDKLTI